MAKIDYEDKVDLYNLPDIPDINKVTASDMNKIKRAVNQNIDDTASNATAIANNATAISNNATATNGKQGIGIYNAVLTDTNKFYIQSLKPLTSGDMYEVHFEAAVSTETNTAKFSVDNGQNYYDITGYTVRQLAGQYMKLIFDGTTFKNYDSLKSSNDINILKQQLIQLTQDIVFSDNGGGNLLYRIRTIYDLNLSKIEIAYSTNPEPASFNYAELQDRYNYISTGITNNTIYIWLKLTYTDIGEVILTNAKDGIRYSVYLEAGGLACFSGDTKILTVDGIKNIEDIELTDIIHTSRGLKMVNKKYSHLVDKIYNIQVGDEIIQASYSHPFITNRGTVISRDLIVGDILKDINGKEYKITDIKINNNLNIVYEINTDANDYYITDKHILVASEMLW